MKTKSYIALFPFAAVSAVVAALTVEPSWPRAGFFLLAGMFFAGAVVEARRR